jgi:hypothetical protein
LTIAKWNSSIALLTYVGLSWKYKFHATDEKAQHALRGLFFTFGVGGSGEEFFSFFFVFPMCSHQVPNGLNVPDFELAMALG